MNTIATEEFSIRVPDGTVYARKWRPEKTLSDVPVVLMHDSLGCVDLWRGFPEALAQNLSRPVFAYDRLGFGKSGPRVEPQPLDFIVEEAMMYVQFIKTGLSISSYILLGHSVGGGMSITIASHDPNCKAVITISAQAFVEELTRAGIINANKDFEQPDHFERLERWHGEKARWVLDAWTDTWLSPDFADWSLDGCIGNVRCPVLAIHGAKDEYGSTAFAEFITGKSGGVSELLILENCGHMPHKEEPETVRKAVRNFLKTNML